jgi:RNase P subunit RPR2
LVWIGNNNLSDVKKKTVCKFCSSIDLFIIDEDDFEDFAPSIQKLPLPYVVFGCNKCGKVSKFTVKGS